VQHDLAIKNCIQFFQLPMTNSEGQIEMVEWPMMLPHVLVETLYM
jgi:hypothetical protein